MSDPNDIEQEIAKLQQEVLDKQKIIDMPKAEEDSPGENKPDSLKLFLVFCYTGITMEVNDRLEYVFDEPKPGQWWGFHSDQESSGLANLLAIGLMKRPEVIGVQIINRYNGKLVSERWK